MEENKEILALLQKLDQSNRRKVRIGRILCALALVAVLCCAATFGIVYSLVPQANAVLTQAQSVLGNLETTTQQLATVDLEGMVSNVDKLVLSGQQSLDESMEKLNAVDFETLNQAIEDLSDVIEPLAKLANRFR
ncbi:MAG: hypothetical protein PUD80_05570 [Firmicutes bacterium]|nr:hypothetical protein [Bacillota bacterium]